MLGKLKVDRFAVVFFAILLVAFALRSVEIDLRPLHSDEGVNFHFLNTIKANGYYAYSHENYHGPLYFYLTYFAALLFGDISQSPIDMSVYVLRLSSILLGSLGLLLLLPLRELLGSGLVLKSAALLAISSSLVFCGRYAIHEVLFAMLSLGFASYLYLWLVSEKPIHLYGICLCLFGLIATKETFIIVGFALFWSMFLVRSPTRILSLVYQQASSLVAALLFSTILLIACFTGGFQWSGGLHEMLLAVPQWISRNESDVGHFKVFDYYISMLGGRSFSDALRQLFAPLASMFSAFSSGRDINTAGAEPQALLGVGLAIAVTCRSLISIWRKQEVSDKDLWARFLAVWTFLSFAVYSFVSYKTPWLVINITLPALLLLAWGLDRLECDKRAVGIVCTLLVLASSGFYCYRYNFEIPYQSDNPYSYVHTHQGMLDFVADVEHYRKRNKKSRVLVGVPTYWPLPYYFRKTSSLIAYQRASDPEEFVESYDVMALPAKTVWRDPNWIEKYYRFSAVQESRVYFRK